MRTARGLRLTLVASIATLSTVAPPARAARADDAKPGAEAARIVGGLESTDEGARVKALDELAALLAHEPAAGTAALPALKEILKSRAAPERARVARMALKIPGDEALALWWTALDPAREDDDRVLAAAVEAAADRAKDVAFARRLVDAVKDHKEHAMRRALALECLGAVEDSAARLLLRAPRPGADWVEEACRALALGRRGGAEAVPPLLDLVASDRTAVRIAAWESLVRTTGRDLPPRREPWESWWDAHGTEWRHDPGRPVTEPAGDRYAAPPPTHVPRYYDIPLRGKSETYRAVFCLDVSASMATQAIGPARKELSKAIEEMTTRHSFDVIAFNESVNPWQGRCARAHPVMKAKAFAWIEALDPKSYTNLYDAVERAFEEMGRGRHPSPEPARLDAVFLLSDGAPNRGRYHDADKVLHAIVDLSAKQVPVNTIGVGDAPRPLLKSIADATGGQFVSVFE